MESIKMKYIVYARKSSESDEKQIQSIPDQLNALKPQIEPREIISTFAEAKSAKKPGRRAFNDMIAAIEHGEAKGIIAWDPSRLSRNATDSGALIQLMDDGLLEEIVTPVQVFKNNPNDKMWFTFLCAQAKYENDNKSVSIKRALQQKVERGEPVNAPRPGYRTIPGKKKGEKNHEPDPIFFPLFKSLLKKYLTGRCSIMELTRQAKQLGIQNYKGKSIAKTSMFRLLQDPYFAGFQNYKGKLYPLNVLPMVSFAEWEIIQDIIHGRARSLKQRHEFPFGGNLIRCGECGYHIIGDVHTKKYVNGQEQTFIYYRCSKKGQVKCSQPYIKSEDLEKQVLEVLSKIDIPEDFVHLALECINEQNTGLATEREAERKSLQAVYDNANRKLENLLELYISPTNSDHSMLSEEDYIEVRGRAIKERDLALGRLKEHDTHSDDSMEMTAKLFNFTAGIRDRFKNGSLEDKKNILIAIGSNLSILDKKLLIQVRKPFELPRAAFEEYLPQITWVEPKNRLSLGSKPSDRSAWYRVRNEVRTYFNSLPASEKLAYQTYLA